MSFAYDANYRVRKQVNGKNASTFFRSFSYKQAIFGYEFHFELYLTNH